MATASKLTEVHRARESSIVVALWLDTFILVALIPVGIVGGSLTILAEAVRGSLMFAIEVFALIVMRRIHRGILVEFEFGVGKLAQVVNLLIAAGMLFGAASVAMGAFEIVAGSREVAPRFGLALAAIFASINTFINIMAWDRMRRAARRGGSLIMRAQLRSRTVRVLSSLFVNATLTVAAVSNDAFIAGWADALGAAFVAGIMSLAAVDMIRAGVPDLLDRTVEEEVQVAINRALAHHFDDYDQLDRVRSRRSGEVVFVEVALAFDARLTVSEVGRRVSALKDTMQREIGGADISILASSHAA